MSVKSRLFFLVAVMAAGLFAITAFSIFELVQLNRAEQDTLARLRLAAEGADLGRSAQHHFKIQVQEWKNVLIRGGDPQAFEKYWKSFEREEKAVLDRLAKAKAVAADLGVSDRIEPDKVVAALGKLGATYREAIKAYDHSPQATQAVDKSVRGIDRDADKGIDALSKAFTTVLDETQTAAIENTQAKSETARTLILAGAAITLMIGAGCALVIIGSIVRPLGGEPEEAKRVAEAIAGGDLTVPVPVQAGDTGSLMAAMRQMQQNLASVVAEISAVVAAAARGDFSKRIDLAGKQGFGKDVSSALNQLTETTDAGLNDVKRVLEALANGDLTCRIDKDYPGVFGETGRSVNATTEALRHIVSDIGQIADTAGQGDFSVRVAEEGKCGFSRDLAGSLNRLSQITDEGLRDVMRVASALAQGDLTQSIQRSYPGLFGETRSGINATVTHLDALVRQIKEVADSIKTAAGEIAAGNQDLSSRTEEQASSLEETASSLEELSATVKNNALSARGAHAAAEAATEVARRGGETAHATAETMTEVARSSNRIADIIGVIDGIAFQTNILALNAAVEAARAGEQGRGFAVVASEVRSLALRSADAAKEIKILIDDSVARVSEGTRQATKTGEQMNEIVHAIENVSSRIRDISAASDEQATGIDQVSLAVQQMDHVTQQNAAMVEEVAAAATSLQAQAGQLADAIAVFRMAGSARPLLPEPPRPPLHGRMPARPTLSAGRSGTHLVAPSVD